MDFRSIYDGCFPFLCLVRVSVERKYTKSGMIILFVGKGCPFII